MTLCPYNSLEFVAPTNLRDFNIYLNKEELMVSWQLHCHVSHMERLETLHDRVEFCCPILASHDVFYFKSEARYGRRRQAERYSRL